MSEPTPAAAASTRRGGFRRVALAVAAACALAVAPLAVPAASAATVTHTIAQVQGPGATTPLNGQTVTVQGIVTAVYPAPSGYNGFFLQTQGSGGGKTARTGASDGLFVFTGSGAFPGVKIGDKATVTGRAGEYQGQTQVTATAAGSVEVVDSGYKLPKVTSLPDTVLGDARESYEGMLVKPSGTYVLGSTHQAYNFGSLWLSAGGELVQATDQVDAGPEAAAIAAENKAKRLLVDDGYSIQVTNGAHPGTQPYLTKETVVRNGDVFVPSKKPMVLGYGFDDWRLQPQIALNDASKPAYKPSFEPANPRPEAAPEVGGDVQFAAFNVFNYFTTFGGDARGAADAEAFAIQKSKIVRAVNGLDADVVALQEIENSVKLGEELDEALADLVAGLNAEAGEGAWDFVPTPAELDDAAITDFITNAIIYKPAAVTPVGDSFTQIDEDVWDIAREPIAQTFEVARGTNVTVVANHFKSKSGSGTQPADGQGFFNAERVEQAEAVAGLVEDIRADDEKGPHVLLLGDFNAYGQEDPIQALTGAGLVDLVPAKAEGQHTYSFDGQLGSLDHAIATPELAEQVAGVGVWGINAAEWSDRGYGFGAAEAGTPYRSSDHDPILVGVSAEDAPAQPVDIDILSFNDFHGRIEAAPPAAGAAVLGGLARDLRAANPNTLVVSAGDSVGASTFTSFIQQDQPTIDALNAIGLDATALGNHEFDQGRDDVDDRLIPESDFPYLGANVYDRETGEPAFDEYAIEERDGVRVGFIGAITEDMPGLVSPDGIATLEFRSIVDEVSRVAEDLRDGEEANGEADVLVLLVHEGAGDATIESATGDTPFGEIVNGLAGEVDAIVSAHTHQQYVHEIPVPGSDRTMPVIQSGQYGEAYGLLSMTVDPDSGELLEIGAEIAPLVGAAEPDPAIAEIVADAVAVAEVEGAVSLGSITGDITRGQQAAGGENRGAESTLGNLIADVQLEQTQDLGTQVAIMNPGGIRADLNYASTGPNDPDGNVTYREAAVVQPFANTLVTLDLTGAQLEQVLEEQWQPAGLSRPFLKLGLSEGLTYTYDPDAAAGERITAVYLDGERVTAEQTIKVVTNSFLGGGGDQFFTFAEGTNRADSGRIDLQAFVDYFSANSPVSPDLGNRSLGVTASAPADEAGYAPGEEVSLDLSSLLFSKGGPTSGEATVSAGEEVLGSAPIAFAITDAYDEQGAATVSFTVPEDAAAGELLLTIGGPEGTAVPYAITVAEQDGGPVEPVEPVSTWTSASASKFITFDGTVDYRVRVTADDGSAPVGELVIRDGAKVVETIQLDEGDAGKATAKLAKLTRGIHLLTATFEGEGFEQSVSWPSILLAL
ncbi:ExeM/NucH family extracellular endonuclease [Homoserinibacter sp. YIM 151385]|uniref:ExeM/NucH family extracellular endonuclease n=1 Tax=Homoserinibacter sp. YIM 151385 TaxID=2985506 RepID=UPI0022F0B976|nr:ExeM/NucH family extracellular endonuclease [Homoserinibacter sp. YIM 151385]WBU37427.1 ExeM/NucH family extracellular endonuclease [Homoserinibacter sp. YIM 151385]